MKPKLKAKLPLFGIGGMLLLGGLFGLGAETFLWPIQVLSSGHSVCIKTPEQTYCNQEQTLFKTIVRSQTIIQPLQNEAWFSHGVLWAPPQAEAADLLKVIGPHKVQLLILPKSRHSGYDWIQPTTGILLLQSRPSKSLEAWAKTQRIPLLTHKQARRWLFRFRGQESEVWRRR